MRIQATVLAFAIKSTGPFGLVVATHSGQIYYVVIVAAAWKRRYFQTTIELRLVGVAATLPRYMRML